MAHTEAQIALTVIIGTLLLLLFIGLVVLLLVVNSNRRHRHRAQLAELRSERDAEVAKAQQEATQQTLQGVAKELHDNVGQLLSVAHVGLNLELLQRPEDQRLLNVREALESGIDELRRLSHDLDADHWQEKTIVDAIEREALRVRRMGGIHIAVEQHGAIPRLPPEVSTMLFRVFQEVLNNSLKHSGADRIIIEVEDRHGLAMTITDNGKGFDLADAGAKGGLRNIPKRCALVNYRATCTTSPDNGCRWTIIPHYEHGT